MNTDAHPMFTGRSSGTAALGITSTCHYSCSGRWRTSAFPMPTAATRCQHCMLSRTMSKAAAQRHPAVRGDRPPRRCVRRRRREKSRLTGGERFFARTCRASSSGSPRSRASTIYADHQRRAPVVDGDVAQRRRASSPHRQPRYASARQVRATPRRFDELGRVLAGIATAALLFPRFKLDTVVIRGVNDDELVAMVGTKAHDAEVRFIECMDVGGTRWSWDRVVTRAEILARLSEEVTAARRGSRRARLGPRRSVPSAGWHSVRHHCLDHRAVLS